MVEIGKHTGWPRKILKHKIRKLKAICFENRKCTTNESKQELVFVKEWIEISWMKWDIFLSPRHSTNTQTEENQVKVS